MRPVASVTVLIALSACTPGPVEENPEFVYLRTDSVTVTVSVRSEARVAVGDWLALKATRTTTGQWRKVPFKEVSEDTPWIGYVPPEREDEVAAKLHWQAEPSEGVRFDVWPPKSGRIQERAVKFAKPGTYRLWATSHSPLQATSNALHVEVLAR